MMNKLILLSVAAFLLVSLPDIFAADLCEPGVQSSAALTRVDVSVSADEPRCGIKPYIKNSSYWEYHGKPIMLIGGSDRDNIFQWAGHSKKLTDHLDLLFSCGGNYIRCTMSSREYTSEGYRWDLLPYPFARINGKYDLTKWNDVYWNKLRTFLIETRKRGIIVQLEFWDRWNECGDSRKPNSGWYHTPWNPNNNSTYNWADSPLLKPGRTNFYNTFHYAAIDQDPVLLPLQKDFTKKVIDEVIDGGFDHVLFQIDNESGIGDDTLEPDPYWARFTRNYAESKGVDVYVCTSRRFHWPTPRQTIDFQDWNNPEIRVPIVNTTFNFCDISQNNGNHGQQHYDNLIWYQSKVQEHGLRPINHTKCYHFNWPTGTNFHHRTSPTDTEAGSKFWRAVFAGAASIRFHRHTPTRPGGLREGFGLSPEGQRHLSSMREFINVVDLFTMKPYNDLLSQRVTNEAYCLAEPGRQYAVFFTGDADRCVRIELAAPMHSLQLRWLNVATSQWVQKDLNSDVETCTLKAPGSGHWVAVLTSVNPKNNLNPL